MMEALITKMVVKQKHCDEKKKHLYTTTCLTFLYELIMSPDKITFLTSSDNDICPLITVIATVNTVTFFMFTIYLLPP